MSNNSWRNQHGSTINGFGIGFGNPSRQGRAAATTPIATRKPMRFDLNQTNAQSFVLSLPDAEGRARVIGFEYITDLGGAVEILHDPHLLVLESAAANGCRLTEVDWNLPGGRIVVGSTAAVSGLFVDARVPLAPSHGLPMRGRATLRLLDAEHLQLGGFVPDLSCGLRIAQLAVEQSPEGGAASLGALTVHELRTMVAGMLLQLGTGTIEDVEANWKPGSLTAHLGSASFDKLTASSEAIEISAERVALTRPAAVSGGRIHIGELTIDEIKVAIDDLPGLLKGSGSGGGSLQLPLDLRLLDLIDGNLEIAATVDASVPIIGRRKATHEFRLPIERGTIDYKKLERGLSTLEDAVIDFELKDSRLVIERDIPIIRMRKDLVEWSLDADELALARCRRVRLRTLPRYRMVSGGGGDFELKSIRLDPIDIALSMGAPRSDAGAAADPGSSQEMAAVGGAGDRRNVGRASTQSGGRANTQSGGRASTQPGGWPDAIPVPTSDNPALDGILPRLVIGSLELAGTLGHPEKPGMVTVAIDALTATLRDLPIDRMKLSVGELSIDSLGPAQITFHGVEPDALSLTIRGLRLQDVTLDYSAVFGSEPGDS